MGDIADDHFVQIFWEEGTGYGSDVYGGPAIDHPSEGGMNAYLARRAEPRWYACKFCGGSIGFIQRKPFNMDGTAHTCIVDGMHRATTQRAAVADQGRAGRVAQSDEAPLLRALKGLLAIEDARIAGGMFKPNADDQQRIDDARAIVAEKDGAA